MKGSVEKVILLTAYIFFEKIPIWQRVSGTECNNKIEIVASLLSNLIWLFLFMHFVRRTAVATRCLTYG